MKREHFKLAALATAALLLASGSAAAQSATTKQGANVGVGADVGVGTSTKSSTTTTEPGDSRAEKKRTKAKPDRRDHRSQGTTSDTQGDASIRGDVKGGGAVKTPQN